jgi:hypothetical protein
MSEGDITLKISFEDLLRVVDQLSLEQRMILRARLDQPFEIPGEAARKLYELYAPVRNEAASMSEQEVNDVIDQAIKEVRKGE